MKLAPEFGAAVSALGFFFVFFFRPYRRSRFPPQKCSRSDGCCGTSWSPASRCLEGGGKRRPNLKKKSFLLFFSIITQCVPPMMHPLVTGRGDPSLICTGGSLLHHLLCSHSSQQQQRYHSCASLPPPWRVCGRFHCITSDSHNRKFPGRTHTRNATLSGCRRRFFFLFFFYTAETLSEVFTRKSEFGRD